MIEFYNKNKTKITYVFTIIFMMITIYFLVKGMFFPGDNSRIGYVFLFVIFLLLSVITFFSTLLLGDKK